VASEFFPEDAGREAIFNCTSDAACALFVEAGAENNRIVSSAQVTKGYYWDCGAMRNEIVASYFPTARHVIDEALRAAGWNATVMRLAVSPALLTLAGRWNWWPGDVRLTRRGRLRSFLWSPRRRRSAQT
jgi:hypothetical protein